MVKRARRLAVGLTLALLCGGARADTTFLAPEDFLQQSFAGPPPKAQFLWLDNKVQAQLTSIFGHPYAQARLRYWRSGARSAWILEDIGKEFPITAGYVVDHGAIDAVRVLIYREARGDEVRYPGFTRQFKGAQLKDDGLDTPIDGISGATLSVAAMQRMARAALLLDRLSTPPNTSPNTPPPPLPTTAPGAPPKAAVPAPAP